MTRINFADGPLFFPVTPFAEESGDPNLELLAEHIQRGLDAGPGGIFPACGTGEFHALSTEESHKVVSTAVDAAAGKVPVIAGLGGALVQAKEAAKVLESAGADGFLLLPPYLVSGTQEGLFQYVKSVTIATKLPIILYHRANAQFTAATVERLFAELPTVIGLKDGVGEIAVTQDIALSAKAIRPEVLLFNGLLTAEASQAAYAAIGVPLYSSAIFAAQPEIAVAFYRAYCAAQSAATDRLLREFYLPLVRLRDTVPGYAVSLIKAANRLRGLPVGGVRPPLVDPSPDHMKQLEELLDHGLQVAAEIR